MLGFVSLPFGVSTMIPGDGSSRTAQWTVCNDDNSFHFGVVDQFILRQITTKKEETITKVSPPSITTTLHNTPTITHTYLRMNFNLQYLGWYVGHI